MPKLAPDSYTLPFINWGLTPGPDFGVGDSNDILTSAPPHTLDRRILGVQDGKRTARLEPGMAASRKTSSSSGRTESMKADFFTRLKSTISKLIFFKWPFHVIMYAASQFSEKE